MIFYKVCSWGVTEWMQTEKEAIEEAKFLASMNDGYATVTKVKVSCKTKRHILYLLYGEPMYHELEEIEI